jgi:hypothetical protein
MGQVSGRLRRRTAAASRNTQQLQQMLQARPPGVTRTLDARRRVLKQKLQWASQQESQARQLHEDLALLSRWMARDVLAAGGPAPAVRRELYDFIVAELRSREDIGGSLVAGLAKSLENQRDSLLGFAQQLQERLERIAAEHRVPPRQVQEMACLHELNPDNLDYWQRRQHLQRQLGRRFFALDQEVAAALDNTPRATSLVENLNGRLRGYFHLRRQLGGSYLHLLRFFVNHRPYLRSARRERVGKTPAQLMLGREHPHWLTMLGYQRFNRSSCN